MEVKINEYTLVLASEVLNILDRYTQHHNKAPESGGVILGRVADKRVLIERLSIPTELDRCSRTNFERHRLSAQIVINHEFANSHGQTIYLGEWHTHPEDDPHPSSTDIRMIKDQFNKNMINDDFLILLIKGRKKLFSSIITNQGIIYT